MTRTPGHPMPPPGFRKPPRVRIDYRSTAVGAEFKRLRAAKRRRLAAQGGKS